MQIKEIVTGTKTPQQARINALKQTIERDKQQLHSERERQRRQRDAERLRKLRAPSALGF